MMQTVPRHSTTVVSHCTVFDLTDRLAGVDVDDEARSHVTTQ